MNKDGGVNVLLAPCSGSYGLGTLLTVTGTGFSNENASIMVGSTVCDVEQVTCEWNYIVYI